MNRNFNLLLLHTAEDIHPRAWICFKGPKLKIIFRHLERDVLKNQGWSREKLSKEVAVRLNCAHTTIKRRLQEKREFYPIPVILELLKFSKQKKKFLREIKQNIEYLKVNSASAKPIKAIYKLNRNLAKILGAFMADGSLSIQVVIANPRLKGLKQAKQKLTKLKIHYSMGNSPSRSQHYISVQVNKNNFELLKQIIPSSRLLTQTHYNIELSDEYKDNVEAFIAWIKEEFGINPNRFEKRKNAWRISFSNKILTRYLITFFDVKPGPKAYSAFEPEIIKRSKLKIRKEFAKGVLMFDGCVSKQSKILFSTVSQSLYVSIKEIWEKDNLKFGASTVQRKNNYNPRKREKNFLLFTTAKNRKEKILEYFEPNSQKWKLINWLSGDLTHTPVFKATSFLSLKKVLKILQKIKRCDAAFLENYFNCSHWTIRTHLKILRAQNKIKLSNQPSCINNYVSKNTGAFLENKFHKLLFKKAREKFKKYKNFANFIGIHEATISAWKLKKNKIPIYIIKEMCKILEVDFNKVLKNIAKTDREIAEII